MKKKTHTEELITEPFIIKDEKTVERLLDALDSPKKEIKPNPNMKEITAEELWEIIDKAAKDIYEKRGKDKCKQSLK